MTMNMRKRAEIAQGILNLCVGSDFETAISAQCDAIATAIGAAFQMQGKTSAEAEDLVRDLAEDMAIRHIRKHWGTIEVAS